MLAYMHYKAVSLIKKIFPYLVFFTGRKLRPLGIGIEAPVGSAIIKPPVYSVTKLNHSSLVYTVAKLRRRTK